MDIICFVALLLLLVVVLAVLVVSIVFTYFTVSSGFMHSSPPVPSCGKVKKAMIEDVAKVLENKKNMVIMDLGSGWGSLLLPLAKRFPQHKFIGIEYGYIPYAVSNFRARNLANMKFYRRDFFEADISKADVIFLFLLTNTMVKLTEKCRKETKKGTLIYANRFPLKDVKAKRECNLGSKYYTYYVYEI